MVKKPRQIKPTNSNNKIITLIKQGTNKVINNWQKIITIKARHSNKQSNLRPAQNLKRLIKLLNIYFTYNSVC